MNLAIKGVIAAGALALAGAAWAQAGSKIRTPVKWVPGQQMPVEDMRNYPCHMEDQPCSKIPPPRIEKVKWGGALGDAAKGEKIALDLRWGNCIACHSLPGGHEGGNIGPSLAEYAKRNMPLDYTFQRMPVYGPNRVLTEQEIRDVMAFLMAAR
jgi:sulfur-oxidizing protein SoxX